METDNMIAKSHPNTTHRLLPAVLPVLFIAITYVDPGKWVAAIEGGARFGYDLIVLMFVFSLAAVLCQYLSASIAVVTGKDLAQICSTEYDKVTCVFLGIQAELSMIALDLTMILGTAHALNLTFGIGLFTCVVLTSLDAFLFPVVSSYLECGKAKFICMWLAVVALFSYFFGVVTSQRDTSLSMGGMLTNLSGESAFALMGLLGASIMPHNLYLHSSMVQQDQGPTQISKGALCHDHLFAISCVFSGIFVINCFLMNSAANVFYSTGLDLLTFQDALSLMDQVFRSFMAPFALIIVLVLSYHTTALMWKFSGQSVLLNFFKLDIPGWCHHSTIRFISLIPALLSTWHSGAEGAYQLMLFTQVTVAILLPSSVVPLFRIASSRSIMGANKITQFVEYAIWVTYIGILGLVIVFLVEMVFGNSDWASNLRWTMWVPYLSILTTAIFSISLMLWLVVTPLKSASSVPDVPTWDNIQNAVPESTFVEEKQESPKEIQEMTFTNERDVDSARDFNLPDDLLDYDNGPRLTTIEENSSYTTPSLQQPEESPTIVESVSSPVSKKEIDDSVEKTLKIDGNLHLVKPPDCEPEDPPKMVSETGTGNETNQSPTYNGPGSFRSLSGKSDDTMSGPASLSKLAGLGRAARRQLATTLDDFWKLLFDLHGEMTQVAKNNKLDKLLGIDSKVNVKASPVITNVTSPVVTNMSSPEIDPVYGVQRGSTSLLTSYQQLLDAYTTNPGLNVMDPEKRYHSLRLPHASGPYMDQPATVHGYQIKSYINQTKQTSDYFQNQLEPVSPKSPPLVSSNYKSPVSVTKTQQNGLRPAKPPGFPDPVVSRNSSMQPERTYQNIQPVGLGPGPGPVENVHEKKYYSMPDISGLLPNREPKTIPERDGGSRYGTLGQSVYTGPLYRTGSISGYGGLSYSNLSRDAAAYHPVSSYGSRLGSGLGSGLGSDTWSMWSKQPSEQFGVAEKVNSVNPRPDLSAQEMTTPAVDSEANLIKSLRLCVFKLLKLEGSEWLFNQNGGLDEDLVDRVAVRERFLYEIEVNRVARGGGTKVDETEYNKYLVTSVPNCGDDCVWRIELIKSFGVWCMHRILELSLMESRPELWGKYTYVLNRLQGIIEPAFSKPRVPTSPCFCLQVPDTCQQRSSPPKSTTSFPPQAKPSRGKCTTAASLLDIVKNVETAISCRKGRPGTAAGDVAFPKGKENLASVLKRYKRRLLAVAPDGLSRSP
ncbi:putative NRAMP family protein [Helianthus annuus]|uniref:NRAMP family protein n=1 Tax=Helianthus annuus TaxID=4232 RepID=A0A251VS93_HELAN|nr:ethylene-insensitive protein 2 [Helianthus annuus]KAF5823609.1 putative NRAMP family protein [Helianthus annuus]KAJ0624578.1 putative NRAMP family protein [Helianthus annuus]